MNKPLLNVLVHNSGEDYTMIIYKKALTTTEARHIQGILKPNQWATASIPLTCVKRPDFKFYLNKQMNKPGTKAQVYLVWDGLSDGRAKLTDESGSRYLVLKKHNADFLLRYLTDAE